MDAIRNERLGVPDETRDDLDDRKDQIDQGADNGGACHGVTALNGQILCAAHKRRGSQSSWDSSSWSERIRSVASHRPVGSGPR